MVPAAPSRAADLGEFTQLAERFRLSLEARNRAPATVTIYLDAVYRFRDFLSDQGMPLAVTAIRREHVESFIAKLLEVNAPGTARNRYKSLQVFFRWAVEEDEIPVSPMAKMHEPTVPDRPPAVGPLEDLRALLKACEGKGSTERRDAALIMLLIDSGLRRAEAASLRVEDLDLQMRTVMVTGKGGRIRQIAFQAKTAQAIDRYLRVRRVHALASKPDLWLGRGQVLTGWGVASILEKRSVQAGIKPIHAPQLRHTFAHQWRLAGGDDDSLMTIAGWCSREMLNRYGRSAAAERALEAHKRYSLGDRL